MLSVAFVLQCLLKLIARPKVNNILMEVCLMTYLPHITLEVIHTYHTRSTMLVYHLYMYNAHKTKYCVCPH